MMYMNLVVRSAVHSRFSGAVDYSEMSLGIRLGREHCAEASLGLVSILAFSAVGSDVGVR